MRQIARRLGMQRRDVEHAATDLPVFICWPTARPRGQTFAQCLGLCLKLRR